MSYGTQKNKTCVYCVYICYILVVFSKLVSSVFLGGIPWAFEIRSILEMQWCHGRGSSWGQVGGYSNGSIRLPGSKYVQNKPWPFWPGKWWFQFQWLDFGWFWAIQPQCAGKLHTSQHQTTQARGPAIEVLMNLTRPQLPSFFEPRALKEIQHGTDFGRRMSQHLLGTELMGQGCHRFTAVNVGENGARHGSPKRPRLGFPYSDYLTATWRAMDVYFSGVSIV